MFAYCNNNSVNYCDPSGHSLTPFTKYIDDGGGSRFSGQFTSALPSAAAAGIGKAISEFAFSGDLKKSLQAGVDVALQVITITLHPDLIDVYVMYTFGSNAFDAWSTGASGYRGLLYGLSSVISTMMSTPMWSDELTDFLFQIESSTITELFSTLGMYCLSQDSSDTNSNYSYDLPLPIISGSNTMTGKATVTYSCFF